MSNEQNEIKLSPEVSLFEGNGVVVDGDRIGKIVAIDDDESAKVQFPNEGGPVWIERPRLSAPWTVLVFDQHPDKPSADCFGDFDALTREECEAWAETFEHESPIYDIPAYFEYQGPNGEHDIVKNAKAPKKRPDNEWRNEQRMQIGMMHGIDGLNEVDGY